MKLKRIFASVLAFSILLTGCQSSEEGTTKVVDGKYALATINDEYFLADEIFEDLLETTTGASVAYQLILEKLIKANFPATDEITTNAALICDQIEESFTLNYGSSATTQLEYALSQQGFTSMDEYEQALIYSLQYAEFIDAYVQDHYDEVYADYKKQVDPRIISIIYISASDVENMTDVEKANLEEVQKLLDLGKDFAETAISYSEDEATAELGGYFGLVDSTTDFTYYYGDDVLLAALELNEGETSEAIKGTDGYYFVHCTSTKDEDIKEIIDSTTPDASPLVYYDTYMEYVVFNTYEISYGNDKIKEKIETFVNDALEARESTRKSGEE